METNLCSLSLIPRLVGTEASGGLFGLRQGPKFLPPGVLEAVQGVPLALQRRWWHQPPQDYPSHTAQRAPAQALSCQAQPLQRLSWKWEFSGVGGWREEETTNLACGGRAFPPLVFPSEGWNCWPETLRDCKRKSLSASRKAALPPPSPLALPITPMGFRFLRKPSESFFQNSRRSKAHLGRETPV